MELGLKGKRALITGGSRGIGLGVAQMLAQEGCHLHLAARSAADLATARDKIIASSKVEVTCHAADLSDSASAVKLAKACGDVDFLIKRKSQHSALARWQHRQLRIT